MSRTSRAAVTLAALLLGAAAGRAQPSPLAEPAALRGDSPQTRKRLAEAEQKLLAGKSAEAVEDLQHILDEAGDDLVSTDGRRFRPARWVAHQILAKLPPDALRAYQDRIDQPARKLLDAGTRDRDPRPLWLLLDRFFVSRPAGDGLLLLGDLLFERGEFRSAERVWRRLLPDAGAGVVYPNPKVDVVAVRARVVLAVIFQGEHDRAKAELEAFAAKHPTAAGPFAGTTGPYAATLRAFLDRPPPPAPRTGGDQTWPTFAGDPERTGRVREPFAVNWPAKPDWKKDIPADPRADRTEPRTAPKSPPFGHPVIADGRVYLADGSRVFAFDLATGDRTTVFSAVRPTFPAAPTGPNAKPQPEPCCTLTTSGGRLYARLGPPAIRPPGPGLKAEDSALVCFAPPPKPGRNAPPLRELWRVAPPAADGQAPAVWEGAPLVAGGRMWAALARFEGGRVVHSVACYDPADPERQPERPAWVAELCDSPLLPGAEGRARQELLTLAGRHVVFCSNGGAVVAVDAATGRRAWGFAYPRTARRAMEASRAPDPTPAVAFGGRVFVAPADADRVYALDADTGRPLWESGHTEGVQLLGISRNRLVFTTAGPLAGVRAVSVVNGSDRGGDGWMQAGTGWSPGYGRGLVSDDAVLWPARTGLWFLDPDTGRPLARLLTTQPDPRTGLFGHLAYAGGTLVVVTPSQVWGYKTDSPPYTHPPADPTPRARFEARIDAAEKELAIGNPAAARDTLREVTQNDFPIGWRAWAAARLFLLDPPAARDVLTPDLLGEWLIAPGGELVTLGELADRNAGRPPRDAAPPESLPADRKQSDRPTLPRSARIRGSVRLPPASYPLRPIPGATGPPRHAFITTTRELIAVALETGAKTTRPAAELFTHAADIPEGFVAAGPFAVAVFRLDRGPGWVFRVPDSDPLPDSTGRFTVRTGDRPPPPQLASFTLCGPWLFARIGDHHLLALDLAGRRVAWVRGADGRAGFAPVVFPTTSRVGPHLFATGGQLVAQLSDGRRWTLRTDTGTPLGCGEETARVPWAQPPAEIDGNRLAFSDGPGRVRLTDSITGRVKWVYDAGGESSLSGEPPQVRAWGDAVLVAVRRNYGVELERVDPPDGTPAWVDGAVFLDAGRIDLSAADAGSRRVYVPAGNRLIALTLDDGKEAWAAQLPCASGWVVRAGRRVVVAYPAEAIPGEPVAEVWNRLVASFARCPLPWRLPWLTAALYDAWNARTVPVLLFDPETGKRLRTLTVPARGPGVVAWFSGGRVVVATGDRVVWIR